MTFLVRVVQKDGIARFLGRGAKRSTLYDMPQNSTHYKRLSSARQAEARIRARFNPRDVYTDVIDADDPEKVVA